LNRSHEGTGSDEIFDFVLEGETATSVTSGFVDVILVNLAVLEDSGGVAGSRKIECAALSCETKDGLISQASGDTLLVFSELDESRTSFLDHGGTEFGGTLDNFEGMNQLSVVGSSDHGDIFIVFGEKSINIVVQAVEQEFGFSGGISEASHELVIVLGEHFEMESAGSSAGVDEGIIGSFEFATIEFCESATTDRLKQNY